MPSQPGLRRLTAPWRKKIFRATASQIRDLVARNKLRLDPAYDTHRAIIYRMLLARNFNEPKIQKALQSKGVPADQIHSNMNAFFDMVEHKANDLVLYKSLLDPRFSKKYSQVLCREITNNKTKNVQGELKECIGLLDNLEALQARLLLSLPKLCKNNGEYEKRRKKIQELSEKYFEQRQKVEASLLNQKSIGYA